MGKHVAKGKITNKLQSKKNKKLMKSGNQAALNTGKSIGAKFDKKLAPKATHNAQKKSADRVAKQKESKKVQNLAKEDDIVLPDAGMVSDEDSDNDMAFLDNIAESKQIERLNKARKRQIENLGEDFEQGKRSFGDEDGTAKRSLLPVVNLNSGLKEHRYEELAAKELNDIESESSDDEEVVEKEDKPLTLDEVRTLQDEQLGQWSNRLVQASNRAMASPEMHGLSAIKLFVQALHFDDEKRYLPILVRQRAMLSGGKVLEDILPSYRIRKLTEGEMKEKVRKDLKILRTYEQGLLEGYQKFLKRVEFFLQIYKSGGNKTGGKRKKKNAEVDPCELLAPPARLALARTAIKTLCNLMVATTHFNFHENLIETVVPYINDYDDQIGEAVATAIGELFKADRKGDKILVVVRKIAAIVRAKGHKVDPRLINILGKLRIKQVEKKQGKDEKDKEREKTDRNQVSRTQNKQRKKEAKLMKELKETEAVENQDDRLHFNSQTIEAIFGIYFRILKSARNGHLLGPVLLGIGKFAHLINLDLIGPLLTLLGDVLGDRNVPMHNRLKSAKSSAAILSGEGEELLVDPRQLYLYTYQIMDRIQILAKRSDGREMHDPWPSLFDVLWALLIDRKKHLNTGRARCPILMSHNYRILTLAVRLADKKGEDSSPFILSLLLIVRGMVIHHRCTKGCLDDEAEQSSLPVDKLDPDLVQPNRVCCTTELTKLTQHPNKLVQVLAKHIADGAPSNVKLPRNMSRKRPVEIYRESRYGFLKAHNNK